MKFLFVLQHPGIFLRYSDIIQRLCQEGHEVVTHCKSLEKNRQKSWSQERLEKFKNGAQGKFHYEQSMVASGVSKYLVSEKRKIVDYTGYLRKKNPISTSDFVKIRAGKRLRPLVRYAARYESIKNIMTSEMASRFFLWMENIIPPDKTIMSYIDRLKPDMVIASPFVQFDSIISEIEYIKCAKALNIPTAAIIASWDNLTSKGLFQVFPDKVYVWNKGQVIELEEIHKVSGSKCVYTGAPSMDKWFEQTPGMDKAQFLQNVGIGSDKSYITYLCSSANIASDEPVFVEKLINKLESSMGSKRPFVLVRPHPLNIDLWDGFEMDGVVVYPNSHEDYVEERGMEIYFHSLLFSSCVIGLNTTAMIEAAIMDKPLITIISDRYRGMQENSAHFHHLLDGEFMEITANYDEAIDAIRRILKGGDQKAKNRMMFVNQFVRPHGMDKSASGIMAQSLIALANGNHISETKDLTLN